MVSFTHGNAALGGMAQINEARIPVPHFETHRNQRHLGRNLTLGGAQQTSTALAPIATAAQAAAPSVHRPAS